MTYQKEAFFKAITHGRINEVKELLKKQPYLINATSRSGNNPLMVACLFYNAEIVEYLIQQDPELVNKQDTLGNTVLNFAPSYLIGYLISMGSDYTIRNYRGLNILEQYIYDESADRIKEFYKVYPNITERHINFERIAKHIDKKYIDFEVDRLKSFWRRTIGIPRKRRIHPPLYHGMPALIDRFE